MIARFKYNITRLKFMDLGRYIKRFVIAVVVAFVLGFAGQYIAAPPIIQSVANSQKNMQRVQAEFIRRAEVEIEKKFKEQGFVRFVNLIVETFSLSRAVLDDILSSAKISARDFIIKEFRENRIRVEMHETPAWIRWNKTDYTFKIVWINEGQKIPLVYFTVDKDDGLKTLVKDEKGLAVMGAKIEKIAKEAAQKKAKEEARKFGSGVVGKIKRFLGLD